MTFDLTRQQSLADAFAERVAQHPERDALTVFRSSGAAEHQTLSFAELDRRARIRAVDLAARLAPGERIVIALPTCTEFVEFYLACLMSGIIAVPAPAAVGSSTAVSRVAAIVADCAPRLVITTAGTGDSVGERLHTDGLTGFEVETVTAVPPGAPAPLSFRDRGIDRNTLALLQYSSGATGSPKGVMLSHGNVQTNIAAVTRYFAVGDDDSFGSWMPLHHDFGLYVQLSCPLFGGVPAILMPPSDFARRPIEWLRMLTAFGITVTSAPNFAFDMCTRSIPDEHLDGLDLSRIRFLVNGSEPIHAPTMAAFAKRFARTGLLPEAFASGYGMAEATVYVSATPENVIPTVLVADPGRLEDSSHPEVIQSTRGTGKEIVGLGPVDSTFETRIVDPGTSAALPDGAVGELWLSGDGVGQGYWNKPELSDKTFRARLADDADPDRTWLRTGDLGAFVDGELFVTGRLKETLIIGGRNLFPQDLEHEARAAHAALRGFVGAAFGVDAPEERVVLVHEISPRVAAEEYPAIAAAVTKHLTAAFGIPARNLLLVRRGRVQRTTSGKIQRRAMRQSFLAGEVTALYTDLEPAVRRMTATGHS